MLFVVLPFLYKGASRGGSNYLATTKRQQDPLQKSLSGRMVANLPDRTHRQNVPHLARPSRKPRSRSLTRLLASWLAHYRYRSGALFACSLRKDIHRSDHYELHCITRGLIPSALHFPNIVTNSVMRRYVAITSYHEYIPGTIL